MSSSEEFVKFVVGQIDEAGVVTYRKMFGEYGIYSHAKMVALVCDNQFFVKPTAGGRAFIGAVTEAPPYPGAKACFLIEDKLEDKAWLSDLIRLTEQELPAPRPKKAKRAAK
jgi:TfoX/Sxy family transcriptional regulator of competence genes